MQGGCGGDQCERVAVGFAIIGVLLDERADNGVLEWLVGGALAQRGGDVLTAFRGERDDDRLLAAGEVVVVGARGDPGGLGDVVDPNVLRSVFEGQAQRGGTQGLPGRELLALAHAAVAGAHASQSYGKYARTHNCVHATSV